MAEKYPTINGVSIPVFEVEPPPSQFNPNYARNYNNHHHQWTRREMAKFGITQTFRDLARHQSMQLRDVHQWVHDTYDPPEPPTLRQAMEAVEEAYLLNEKVRLFVPGGRVYEHFPITDEHMEKLKNEYDSLRRVVV